MNTLNPIGNKDMTKSFGEYYLSIDLRNGVGLDLEFADSRPVWISNSETGGLATASFEGTVLMLPFMIITLGKIWMED